LIKRNEKKQNPTENEFYFAIQMERKNEIQKKRPKKAIIKGRKF